MNPLIYPKIIPLFPLPNLVFFPKTYLPLHIFEPRYRQMVQDAQKEHRIIGMVLLKDGWEKEYYRNPEIATVGCAGELLSVQRLEDGLFNIVLKGIFRFAVKDQFFDKIYREGEVEPFNQDITVGGIPLNLREDLTTLLKKRTERVKGGNSFGSLLKKAMDDATFIHTLSYSLPLSSLEKQFLLESETLVQQTKRLIELIQLQTFEIQPPSPSESG